MAMNAVVRHAAICLGVALAATTAQAAVTTIPITLVNDQGLGAAIGSIRAEDGDGGVTLSPDLTGLPAGPHGMHLHEKPNCGPAEEDGKAQAGLAAGGHWDPTQAGKHLGPDGGGHKGDLPVLEVAPDGTARTAMRVPRLAVADLQGHALMIHAGGDNFADQPLPLGGGGGRIACGVVPGPR